MKKNLIVALALVFVLGIASTAFAAANPFVDVPAKHWAYDAVSKLAQAGILDGYGDGTYRGERLATRYEMAQATAKAMARSDKANAQLKALIDKLAVEFAAELNNLGVRVAKLEKNASSIKFGGDSRLYMQNNTTGLVDETGVVAQNNWNQRVRITAVADVNEKVQFIGRWMASWNTASTITATAGGHSSTDMYWDYAYFQWTFNPSFKLAVGRQGISIGQGLFNANGGYDSVGVYFGAASDKFKARVSYGDMQAYSQIGYSGSAFAPTLGKPVLLADLNYDFSKTFSGNFTMFYGVDADKATALSATAGTYATGYPFQVYNLGFKAGLGSDFTLRGTYFWNVARPVTDIATDSHNGWMASLGYKGASYSKVNSWGVMVTYRDIKPWAIDIRQVAGYGFLSNSMVDASANSLGQKGWGLQAEYAISKNAILTTTYEALSRNSVADARKLLPFWYVQLNVVF